MLKPFYNEEVIHVGEDRLRLVLNFRAIDAAEGLIGKPFSSVLAEVADGTAGEALVGKVVWGLLREHHPELSIDQVAGLLFGPPGILLGGAVNRLLHASFSAAEEPEAANPPKPRGASKPS